MLHLFVPKLCVRLLSGGRANWTELRLPEKPRVSPRTKKLWSGFSVRKKKPCAVPDWANSVTFPGSSDSRTLPGNLDAGFPVGKALYTLKDAAEKSRSGSPIDKPMVKGHTYIRFHVFRST